MSALHVAVRGGSYVCYRTDNGITREYVGCRHDTPRAAISHNANTDPYVRASGHGAPVTTDSSSEAVVAPSPEPRTNRVSGSGSTRVPTPPSVNVESPPEPRRRGSRQ